MGGGAPTGSTGVSVGHYRRFRTREDKTPLPPLPTPCIASHPVLLARRLAARTHHHVPLHLGGLNHCLFLHAAPSTNATPGPGKSNLIHCLGRDPSRDHTSGGDWVELAFVHKFFPVSGSPTCARPALSSPRRITIAINSLGRQPRTRGEEGVGFQLL